MKKVLDVTLKAITIYMIFDFMCFFAWVMSGQLPQVKFYFGVITSTILKAIIF